MNDDDELCLCFHVSKRKVVNYIRNHRPQFASQLSECMGAGTGCGWCRPLLRRLLEDPTAQSICLPDRQTHALGRTEHLRCSTDKPQDET